MVSNAKLFWVEKVPGYSPGKGEAELSAEGQCTRQSRKHGWRGRSGAGSKLGESFVESPGWD